MTSTRLLVDGVLIMVTATAAFTDARSGKIYNWLTYPTLALGILLHTVLARPTWLQGILISLLGMVLAGLVPYFLFYKQAIGGGDVKLFAAVGALAGPMLGLEIELYAIIATAVMSLFILTWKGKLFQILGNTFALALNPILPKAKRREIEPELLTSMRMGVPIFIATLGVIGAEWLKRGML